MGQVVGDGFRFDLAVKRTRLSDEELLRALQDAATASDGRYFSTTQYEALPGKRPHPDTIINRFGSWKRALRLIGISGGREKQYSPEQLIHNLETIWRELGFPPGMKTIPTLGERISATPYRNHWGSVRSACEALAAFHNGTISREKLLAGRVTVSKRTTIPLRVRWEVMKRDNYRCAKCGASPSNDHKVELEVDHIHPVAKQGGNAPENLQTLCRRCNQGKKDR